MNNIAIIPARSGSKGLKDKNIKILNGKPLLAYSIEAAIDSKMFSAIYVSTDSQVYADIAMKHGADVPFLRPKELATDTASSWDVVVDALLRYNELGKSFTTVTLLQPTSPLRSADDIIRGYRLLEEKNANSVVAVCETDHSPLWCNVLPENHSMSNFINKAISNLPRQQLQQFYRINGALYIVKASVLNSNADIYENNCYAYIMPKYRSIDIDSLLDFAFAETIITNPELMHDS